MNRMDAAATTVRTIRKGTERWRATQARAATPTTSTVATVVRMPPARSSRLQSLGCRSPNCAHVRGFAGSGAMMVTRLLHPCTAECTSTSRPLRHSTRG